MSEHLTPPQDITPFSESPLSFRDWLLQELTEAYLAARKGKRTTGDEHVFEMNAFENLINLRDTILNRTYVPSRGIAFITRKPVIREIFAAPFRDRVVHHFLFNSVASWWDRRLIPDCYSCRVGKGTWYGIYRLAKHMRATSENYKIKTFVIKLDIRGYFMSLSRDRLFERICWGLDRQFPERDQLYDTLRFLWQQIIFDNPVKDVTRKGGPRDWRDLPRAKSLFCQPPGKGIVIGNLSSQLLSNIYLSALDRYMTITLGYKHYGRYVDDFYFFVQAKDLPKALEDIKHIELFLKNLGLTLHPNKRYIQPIERGVPFLGTRIYPGHIIVGERIDHNFRICIRDFQSGHKDVQSIVSYLGFLKNLNDQKYLKKLFDDMGWDYNS